MRFSFALFPAMQKASYTLRRSWRLYRCKKNLREVEWAYDWCHKGSIGRSSACPGGLDIFRLYEFLVLRFDVLHSFILRYYKQSFKFSLQRAAYQGIQGGFKRLHGIGKFMNGRAALSYFWKNQV